MGGALVRLVSSAMVLFEGFGDAVRVFLRRVCRSYLDFLVWLRIVFLRDWRKSRRGADLDKRELAPP